MNNATPIEKKLSKENTKLAQNNPLLLLGDYLSGCSYKNIQMNHKELKNKNYSNNGERRQT